MDLENFASKIENFDSITSSSKIDYFIYYLTSILGKEGVKSVDVLKCFDELKIAPYSNIPSYLKNNSKKLKSKSPKFILKNSLYHLERSKRIEIDSILKVPVKTNPSNNYLTIELFKDTRQYLESIVNQAASCYDHGMFDSCAVMTRKLLEVLIIEAFERHNIASKIKDANDNFFFLSDLIDKFKAETKWHIGRNAKESIPKLKKMGDMSAHNRRYISKKPDIDKLKDDLRIVVEELIHIIDYPTYK